MRISLGASVRSPWVKFGSFATEVSPELLSEETAPLRAAGCGRVRERAVQLLDILSVVTALVLFGTSILSELCETARI